MKKQGKCLCHMCYKICHVYMNLHGKKSGFFNKALRPRSLTLAGAATGLRPVAARGLAGKSFPKLPFQLEFGQCNKKSVIRVNLLAIQPYFYL